jgi:pilus assembly protein Flp/PilA
MESLVKKLVSSFVRNESGATAIEYGLIAALISVVIIGVLATIGTELSAKFNKIATQLQ